MTTATAELCGHHWRHTERSRIEHRCVEPANHPPPCCCRCGATTTREDR